jgi:Sulfate permease family
VPPLHLSCSAGHCEQAHGRAGCATPSHERDRRLARLTDDSLGARETAAIDAGNTITALGAAKTYAARRGMRSTSTGSSWDWALRTPPRARRVGWSCGSLSKTAVNGGAGAHLQVSGLSVAVMTIVTLLLLTGLFEKLPRGNACGGGDRGRDRAGRQSRAAPPVRDLHAAAGPRLRVAARPDFIAAVAAMLGVMVFDTLPGLSSGSRHPSSFWSTGPRAPASARWEVPGAVGHY